MQPLPKIAIMREIQSGGLGMEIPVIIGSLAILSEVLILTFMLMKEWICPFIGQCVIDFCGRVRENIWKTGII